jgi:biopolymer transport protein ExbD
MAGYAPEQDDDDDVIAQINIIPFVDIVLVLLIIFLLTSNLIARAAIPVDLPRAASANESVGVTINIVLTATGELFLDGNPITYEALTTRVAQQLKADPGLRAVIAADKAVRYQYVVQIIDALRQTGLSAFALNIERTGRKP